MRQLVQIIAAQATQDGNGVKINRVAGRHMRQLLNPFLMIDEINSDDAADYIGGFPEHPHRGFETITYMKHGRMRHRDHMGNEGVIAAGDVQWMTAGAGVLHSEMPEQERGLLHGFQLWLNLPAAEKMQAAAYQEITSVNITEQPLPGGGLVRVISGAITINQKHLQGPLPDRSTQPILLDIQLCPQESVELGFNRTNPAMVYVYHGATDSIASQQLGLYSTGSTLTLTANTNSVKCLVLSGQPINEPVVQHGPFVMNTTAEIKQAIIDFQDPQFLHRD